MPSDVSPIVRALARINRSSAYLAGLSILLMMAVGAADVVMTNLNLIGLRSRPIPATTEFIATMMVIAVFLGLSLAQQRRGHIQMDVSQFAAPPVRRVLEVIHHLCHALMYGLIAAFGWGAAAHAVAVREFAAGLFDFPVWPARLLLALGATFMTLQCFADIAGVFSARWRMPAEMAPDTSAQSGVIA
jgi:TRAP-type transport system small permease protein